MPVGAVPTTLPIWELPGRTSITARKSLLALSSSAAEIRRYGDSSARGKTASRDAEEQAMSVTHAAVATSNPDALRHGRATGSTAVARGRTAPSGGESELGLPIAESRAARPEQD